MVEPENEGSNLEPVTFYPDDPQPVSREQPYPTLAPSISADPPLVTVPTSSVTSAPSSVEAIPTNVMKNVEVLTWPNKNAPGGISTVYLVGTTHVSKASCDDVRVVMRVIKPSLVFLELCQSRVALLRPPKKEKPKSLIAILSQVRHQPSDAIQIILSWFYTNISELLDVEIGEEFRVATAEARALNAVLIVGDRPVEVTLKRFWGNLSRWQKLTFCFRLLSGGLMLPTMKKEAVADLVEGLKEEDLMTQTLAIVGAKYPSLKTALIDERNEYMVNVLHDAATFHPSIVAVVGRGHLPGIRENWNRADINIEALMVIPQVKYSRSFGWKTVVGVGCLCVVFVIGYSRRR